MYQVIVSVVANKTERIEFDEQIKSITKGLKYSFFMCGSPKDSKYSKDSYQRVVWIEYPEPLIPEVLELIRKSALNKAWYEYRDENGGIGAKEFVLGNEVYAMCGSINDSILINDVYALACEEFLKKCTGRNGDCVIDISGDNQLHIRRFDGEKLKLIIDGNIEVDNRSGERIYWLF